MTNPISILPFIIDLNTPMCFHFRISSNPGIFDHRFQFHFAQILHHPLKRLLEFRHFNFLSFRKFGSGDRSK